MSKELRICGVCGKQFLSSNMNHRFCSDECRAKVYADRQLRKYREKHNIPQDEEAVYNHQEVSVRKCKICGKEFEYFDDRRGFCSLDCRKADALDMTIDEYTEYRKIKGKIDEALPITKAATLIAYITYQCYECKRKTNVYLEEGVEVGEDSKPAPFELYCPHCGHGVMREVDSWRPLKKNRENKLGERYLAAFPEGDVSVYVYSDKKGHKE